MSSHGPDCVCTQQPWTERSRVCPAVWGAAGTGPTQTLPPSPGSALSWQRHGAQSPSNGTTSRLVPRGETGPEDARRSRVALCDTPPRARGAVRTGAWTECGRPGESERSFPAAPGGVRRPVAGPSVACGRESHARSPPLSARPRGGGREPRTQCCPGGHSGAPHAAVTTRRRAPGLPSPRPGTAAPARPWAPAPPALCPPAGSDASAIDVLMACGVRGDELESVPRVQGDL